MEKIIRSVNRIIVLPLAAILTLLLIPTSWPASTLPKSEPQAAHNEAPPAAPSAAVTGSPVETEKVLSASDQNPSSAEPIATEDIPEIKIVINLPTYELNFIENGQVIKTFTVAIAAPRYAMPIGARQASHIIWNPNWTPPPSAWAVNERPHAPGERGNPLGRVKIQMGNYYLIHGGGDSSVGRAVSHGCVRMRNADVLELARLIIATRHLSISEEQLAKLERNSKRSFGLKIDPPIPVEISYKSLTVENRQVEIYPDVYHFGTNSMGHLKEALLSAGIRYQELSMEEQLSLARALRDAKYEHQCLELAGKVQTAQKVTNTSFNLSLLN